MKKMTLLGAGMALALTGTFGATTANAATISDPQGVLLSTVEAVMTAESPTLDLTNSAGWVSGASLGGDPACSLDHPIIGGGVNPSDPIRRYVPLTINITKAGHFTFRIVDQNPAYTGNNSENPVSDPFLALYKDFNTADLDAGLQGCNDDAASSALSNPWSNGDTFPTNGVSNTNDRWSHFEVELEPGTYTAVFTTFLATADINSGAWSFPQQVTFEYWGPECSIEGATCSSGTLANTGISQSTTSVLGSIALMVSVAGVGALVVVRRSRRA